MRQLRQDVHGFWQFVDRMRRRRRRPCASGSPARWSAATRRRAAGRPGRRGDRRRRRPRRPRTPSPIAPTRTACAARSARTSGAAIRATPTCRPAGPGSSRGRCGRSASTPRRSTRTWSPRRAFTGCCAAAANTASACRRRAGARRAAASAETGLHFICLGANIARQFEFVQSAWLDGRALRRPAERKRSAARHRLPRADGTPTDGFSMPQRRRPRRSARRPAAVRHRASAAPTSSCPASARCASCATYAERGYRHEFEHQSSGAAGQHRLGAAQPASSDTSLESVHLERRFDPLLAAGVRRRRCAIRSPASSPR